MYKIKIFSLATLIASMLFSFTVPSNNATPIPVVSLKIAGTPKLLLKKDVHDFGEIPQGKPVSVEFVFTNDGDAPLLISDVVSVCGCTVPDFPKAPIATGKSSKIKVTYNAANKGSFSKSITIKSNSEEESKVVTIKGTVL